MALVRFGRKCKGSFEGYWIVVLDRQGDWLVQVRGFTTASRDICQSAFDRVCYYYDIMLAWYRSSSCCVWTCWSCSCWCRWMMAQCRPSSTSTLSSVNSTLSSHNLSAAATSPRVATPLTRSVHITLLCQRRHLGGCLGSRPPRDSWIPRIYDFNFFPCKSYRWLNMKQRYWCKNNT